jgi:hypothetical protein
MARGGLAAAPFVAGVGWLAALIRRHRHELAPVWAVFALYAVAFLANQLIPRAWPLALPLGAVLTLVAARRWADGRAKRLYAVTAGVAATAWSALAWWAGPDHAPLLVALLLAGLAAELPWAWHHRRLRAPADRPWWHALLPSRRAADRGLSRVVDDWHTLAHDVGLEGLRLQSITVDDQGWTLLLQLSRRLTIADVAKQTPRLETAFDAVSDPGRHVRPGAMRVEPDPERASRCFLRVTLGLPAGPESAPTL